MTPEESRRFPRAEAPLKIYYSSEFEPNEQAVGAEDLSASGISFQTGHSYSREDILKLRLELLEMKKTIHAEGRVIRSFEKEDKIITAVELFNIDYEDFILILDYSLAFYKQ
ncbi:MAG: PilZ domain-containing protein [Spirochaetia bacterium]|nr:PilZ domain-containing protein [Spirochaetia bacterium]